MRAASTSKFNTQQPNTRWPLTTTTPETSFASSTRPAAAPAAHAYFFSIHFLFFPFIYIISYSPAMTGARDHISMFQGERKLGEETYLHLKTLLPNGVRARVHYIGFKALEKITETLSMVEGIL